MLRSGASSHFWDDDLAMIDEIKLTNHALKICPAHIHNGKVNRYSLRDALAIHFGLSLEIFDKSDLLDRVIAVCAVVYSTI